MNKRTHGPLLTNQNKVRWDKSMTIDAREKNDFKKQIMGNIKKNAAQAKSKTKKITMEEQ